MASNLRSALSIVLLLALFCQPVVSAQLTCSEVLSVAQFDRSQAIQTKDELEKLSIQVIKQIAQKKADHKDSVIDWLSSLSEHQDIQPLNVMEHTSLLYIIKSGIFEGSAEPQITILLENALKKSYVHLTKSQISDQEYLGPLPNRVLRDEQVSSETARYFYESIFNEINQSDTFINRTKYNFKRIGLRATWSRFFQTLLFVTSLNFSTGRGFFAGAIMGLIEASINEYMIHIGVGHATPGMKKFFRYLGRPGQFAQDIILAHSVHHALVKSDFGVAVPSREIKEKAEKIIDIAARSHLIERMVYERYPEVTETEVQEYSLRLKEEIMAEPIFQERLERLKANLRNGNYGVNGTWKGAASMLVTATPFYLLNFGLYEASGNLTYLVSSTLSLTFMVLQSLYSHWYLHLSPSAKIEAATNPIQMAYLETDIGKLALRLHYTHHQLPWMMQDTRNGVIMAGSAWDRLSGDLQESRIADLIKMYEEGWIVPLQKAVYENVP